MVEFNQWGFGDTVCGLCGGKQQSTLNESRGGLHLNLKLEICWCLIRFIPLNF